MGKKRRNERGPNAPWGSQPSMTLREESNGKKQTNVNAKSMLKLEHLKNLAVWASGEASMPSLGAFFGHRLASCAEALGVSPDPTLFPCQRCESILQPGFNCTVRIEKNRAKAQRRHNKIQNNVVYRCHYCSHRNLKRGTPRGHMKDTSKPKVNPHSKPKPASSENDMMNNVEVIKMNVPASSENDMMNNVEVTKMNEVAFPDMSKEDPAMSSPATPSVKPGRTLLEAKKRKRNRSGSKKAAEIDGGSTPIDAEKTGCTTRKRRKNCWTTLKEIAERSEHDSRKSTNLTIPFML